MGIRFYCPNGHKLNVKAFLAGKRGICPHCDARFDIPFESQIPANAPKIRSDVHQAAEVGTPVLADSNGNATPESLDADAPVDEAVDVVLEPATSSASERDAFSKPPVETAPPTTASSTESPHAVSPNGGRPLPNPPARDPLAEAPTALWYVRPPSGGQYGPARNEVMRRWVEEGRVCAESLVWREGWSDWEVAGPIFPALLGDERPQSVQTAEVAEPAFAGAVMDSTQDAVRVRHQAAGSRKSIFAVVFLALLTVVLIVMLIVVLQQSS